METLYFQRLNADDYQSIEAGFQEIHVKPI